MNSFPRFWGLITAITVGSLCVYLSYRNQLVSTRYASYLSYPVVLAAMLLVADVAAAHNMHNSKKWLIFTVIIVQVFSTISMLVYLFPITRISESTEIRGATEVVLSSIEENDNARVALSEIGIFGFYSGLYIVDLVGLIDRATLEYGRTYGRPISDTELEKLLINRSATHYIDTFSREELRNGDQLIFEVVAEIPVRRNNYSRGGISVDLWRVYRLTVQDK